MVIAVEGLTKRYGPKTVVADQPPGAQRYCRSGYGLA